MKVLNLRCSNLHAFEGWFASEDDFQSQHSRGLVQCPVCADSEILKMPSAPRLNFGAHSAEHADLSPNDSTAQAVVSLKEQSANQEGNGLAAASNLSNLPNTLEQTAFLAALRQVMAASENVGRQFAEEARRMHYGETPARNIRGQASSREALEMQEEGIEIMALPFISASAETLQ